VKVIPDWIILGVWRALIGEIYPAIRAVAISISEKNTLVIRYYLEREPVDFDYESLEVVATNVTALVGAHRIPHVRIECEYASKPIGELECLGEFVYSRREYDMEDFIE
jgi:hypothetical protein